MDPDFEIRVGLESRLAALAIVTTGTTTLAATGSTYTRSSGSFLTDGFVIGDAVSATGFTGTANGKATVTAVTATVLTVDRALATVASGGSRSITAGVPDVSYPGQAFAVPPDKAWVRARVRSVGNRTVATGDGPLQRHEGIFLVDVFEPYSSGMGINRLERLASAIRAQFRVTTSIVRSNVTVRISGLNPGSLLENTDNLQVPISIDWWADVPGL